MSTISTRQFRQTEREAGFTLVELLVVLALSAILLTLSATAVRHYSFEQSLEHSKDEMITAMRGAQTRVIAESHPLVYGLRFKAGSKTWALVQYDPEKASDKCTEIETYDFELGVTVREAAFTGGDEQVAACMADVDAGSVYSFFFARGSATPGTVTLFSDRLDETLVVELRGVTGRAVERGDLEEDPS